MRGVRQIHDLRYQDLQRASNIEQAFLVFAKFLVFADLAILNDEAYLAVTASAHADA
jgi:hypothetical protein